MSSIQKTNPTYVGKSFNVLGYFYNPLKRVFLANQPEIAISESVSELPHLTNVMVVGGGDDNTLIELFQNQVCKTTTHVDISSVLSEKAKNRFFGKFPELMDNVKFVISPFLDYNARKKFDAVIFPFYLDLFKEDEVKDNIEKAKSFLERSASIYVVDFSRSKKMSSIMRFKIKVLYMLFYPFTKMRRKDVPDYDLLFKEMNLEKVKEQYFFKGLYQFKVFRVM